MSNYREDYLPYEYFCGANITLNLNDVIVDDIVGISYRVMDSAKPIYGYSSRLFDAVAPGQKLIQGTFVVNYRGPNYIYDALKRGQEVFWEPILGKLKNELPNVVPASPVKAPEIAKAIQSALPAAIRDGIYKESTDPLKFLYWGDRSLQELEAPIAKDVTLMGPARLQINFGGSNRWLAKATHEIHGVYIIGEGSSIEISEDVILEEYSFIGRDIVKFTYEPTAPV